jgi:hypothetical protein
MKEDLLAIYETYDLVTTLIIADILGMPTSTLYRTKAPNVVI